MITLKIKTSIYLLIGIISLLLVATVLFSLYSVNRLKNNLATQVHSTVVILTLDDNLISLLNVETGERGYIITGDTNYLEPYYLGLRNIGSNMRQLRILTKDNPAQQQSLDTLESYIDKRLSRTATLVSLKKHADEKMLKMMLFASEEGKGNMDEIRVINQSMKKEELKAP